MSPRRRWLAVVAVVALVAIGSALARILSDGGGPRTTAPQDRAGPVLLVAGYGGSTAPLERLAVVLRARGRTVEVVPAVGDGTGDLRVQAGQLKAVAERVVDAGAPSVDVVGYSAGGVVTRIWVAELGGSSIARRVVTLGSPHHGAEVAELAAVLAPTSCPPACRQLTPGSTLLAGLPETGAGPRWVSVWSRDDTVVTPPQSSRLAGAVNVELQTVCPAARVSHGQLPTNPLVLSILELALGAGGLTAALAAADCRRLGGAPDG